MPPKSTPITHEGEVISDADIGSKISSLKDKIDQLSPKIDSLPLSPPLSSMIPNPQDCSIFLSDRDINHIDSKIDALRDSIVQLSPRGEAECPHYENTNEATDIELNPGSQFDPSTHDWDSREWVEVEHKRKGKQTSPKPLSYSDILKRHVHC